MDELCTEYQRCHPNTVKDRRAECGEASVLGTTTTLTPYYYGLHHYNYSLLYYTTQRGNSIWAAYQGHGSKGHEGKSGDDMSLL
jgi:hypothetical protein